ncbi:helix-turn-helix domain-containing protein [Streptomyces griseus]|uniref:helix-turn-helix domain-containing protein n=1 Tax=Streptomyces griseus TaxID=1911 RepID=UPI0037B094B3
MPDSSPDMPQLLKQWRQRADYTQADVAGLLNVGVRHYQRLESGMRPMMKPTVSLLVQILDLHPDEASALHRWAGQPAPPRSTPADRDVPEDLIQWLDALPCGGFYEGPAFEILAYNARAAHHWPWVQHPGANIMIDLLLDGPGRRQCVEWETRWAPLLLAQLRQATITQKSSGLREVVDRVCADPAVAQMWGATAELRSHAYGTTRPMIMPGWEPSPAWVTVTAWLPMHRPDLRLVTGVAAGPSVEPDLPAGIEGGGTARRAAGRGPARRISSDGGIDGQPADHRKV